MNSACPRPGRARNFRCSGEDGADRGRHTIRGSTACARLARGEPSLDLALRLDGSQEPLHIQELELTQMPGALSMSGEVELDQPTALAAGGARARSSIPRCSLDPWPGALDFDLRHHGRMAGKGPRANFKLPRLCRESCAAAPISGSGDVTLGPDRRPSGRCSCNPAAPRSTRWQRAAPDRASMRPCASPRSRNGATDLRGALHASRSRRIGRWPDIELDARVSGHRRAPAATTRATRPSSASHARDARAPRGTLSSTHTGWSWRASSSTTLAAKLDGDEHAHEFELDARGEPLSLAPCRRAARSSRDALVGHARQARRSTCRAGAAAGAGRAGALRVTRDSFELAKACLRGWRHRGVRGRAPSNHEFRGQLLGACPAAGCWWRWPLPAAACRVDGMLEGNGDLRRTPDGVLSRPRHAQLRRRRVRRRATARMR